MNKSFLRYFLSTVLLLSGCAHSTSHEGSSSPYAADIAQIIEKSKGTKAETAVREILLDSVVTEAEMLDRAQAQNSCMHEAGFSGYYADPQGDIKYGSIDDEEIEQIYSEEKECEKRTFTLEIGSLYFEMMRNPKKAPEHELMAACLVKLGVVSPSFSGEDYLESLENHRKYESSLDDGRQEPAYAIPYVVDEERGKEAFWQCSSEPQKILYSESNSK